MILHGSPDHLQALRDLHAHHESKRDELKARHGNIYTDVEHVKSELDALSAELHHLTNHAVALDASFDKFGYVPFSAQVLCRRSHMQVLGPSEDKRRRLRDGLAAQRT